MFSKIYWINESPLQPKSLGIMARPRGNDWLSDEVKSLKMRDVDCLVSLLDYDEISELGLKEEAQFCEDWDIEFINFPIQDVTTPKDVDAFIGLVEKLSEKIRSGKRIVIHCRMGIGRSSVTAASVCIKLGSDSVGIFDRIGVCRELKVPDTEEQKGWVLGISARLKN